MARAGSPPPHGEGFSGTPWAHFEWGIAGSGDHEQCTHAVPQLRPAAGTGAGWNSRHLLSITQGREPTDHPPVTRHAERRKLREARSLRAVLGQLFAKLGNAENV